MFFNAKPTFEAHKKRTPLSITNIILFSQIISKFDRSQVKKITQEAAG
ncbi:hypothetical protein FM107_05260 [Sphingobacterium sp. JB170]|nr:hypothetical protein FM107_05260 [Sphingobacterium sp. JB170]